MQRVSAYGLVLLLMCLLSQCGFHLRGWGEKPTWLNQVAIIIEDAPPGLLSTLTKQLGTYAIQVISEPAKAPYWLIIHHETLREEMSGVSSSTTPRQYQLVYSLAFELQQRQHGTVLPSTIVGATRQLTLNSNRILGSKDEEVQFIEEMRHDAIYQMLSRLNRLPPPNPH